MKAESTILDYTKSAEEIRRFKLKEKCHEIAAEYERFNIENEVYEKFGQWLLEKAIDRYSVSFSSKDLCNMILASNEVECPESFKINGRLFDYEWCNELREICPNDLDIKSQYKSMYSWYTLWRIVKAYNGKHGCVVTLTPTYKWSEIHFHLNWSQDASDCISKEKWRNEADRSKFEYKVLNGMIGLMLGFFLPVFPFVFFGIQTYLWVWITSIILFPILFIFPIRNLEIRRKMNKLSKSFQEHCEKINQTRDSEFDVEKGQLKTYPDFNWRN